MRKQWYVDCNGRLRIGSLRLMDKGRLDGFEGAFEPLSETSACCLAHGMRELRERESKNTVSVGWPGAIRDPLLLATILALVVAIPVDNDEVSRDAIASRHLGEQLVVSMELE